MSNLDKLSVGSGGTSSSGNTSTTPLGSGETFTGIAELNAAPDVMVSLQTDNNGTLFFDFSNDGTNFTTFPVNGFEISSGIHEFHTAVKGPRYFRVRLVNDTGAQTFLRLYTYYGQFRQSNSPLNQSVSLDTDAIQVRPTDFQDEVRIGRRAGVTGFTKFGYRDGLTASAGYETVWATTGNFTPQDTAETYTVAYDNSQDGSGQTGALSVSIDYIDSNGDPVIAVHTFGSSGSDTTSFSAFGINRVAVLSSGSAQTNNADITFTTTTSGLKAAVVSAGDGVTNQAIYVNGGSQTAVAKYLFINVGKGSGGGNPKVRVRGRVYNRAITDSFYNVFELILNTQTEQTVQINEPIGFTLSPSDVLFFEADTDTNNAEVYVRFSLNAYITS